MSLYFWIIIRLYVAYIHSRCDRSCLNGNGSACPGLINFIRTFKWCFVFKGCVIIDRDLIPNSVIVVNYCRVFTNYVFFNLILFTLAYISPIYYMIYWGGHVSTKN